MGTGCNIMFRGINALNYLRINLIVKGVFDVIKRFKLKRKREMPISYGWECYIAV